MRPDAAPRAAVILAALLALPAGAALAADVTPQQRIETQLMCYCGCSDLTVRVCTCGTAAAIREEIASRLARGETSDQVVTAFVERHGEKIRSAPTKSGFNLLAWITPFAAILAAGAGLVLVARRWAIAGAGRSAADAPAPGREAGPLTERQRDILARVEREIREGS